MPYEILGPVGVVVGIFAFFFLAVIAAGLWEKRPVQPYYVPDKGEEYQPSTIARRANKDAAQMQYRQCGLCHDGKGKLYKIRYDFWISDDHTILAGIGSGTLAKVPVNGIWLYTLLDDGCVLSATNQAGEQDISGVEDQATWPQHNFTQMIEKHRSRMEGAAVEKFPDAQPMAAYFDMRRRKAEALVEMGYAYYLDDDQMVWRYNLKGAIAFYVVATWVRPIGRYFGKTGVARS